MRVPLTPRLNVLVTTDAVGGVWTYTIDLARALRQEGVGVAIATLGPPPSDAQRAQAVEAGAPLHSLDAPLDWLAADEAGVLHASQAIATLAHNLRADLIQTHSPSYLAQTRMPVPTVSVAHSCVATWWSAVRDGALPDDLRWRARLVAAGLAEATINVAPSRSFALALAEAYGREAPQVVHNASSAAPLSTTAPASFILSAGRFWDAAKDLSTLDRAAELCAWAIVAAGPLSAPDGSATTAPHVQAQGAVSPDALRALLAQRPIFCSTAVYEPFGLAVLEAAQAGCALVLSDIPTFRELWDGAALFAPARAPNAFAALLDDLARNPDRRAALGVAARDRAARYAPERQARDMTRLYARALRRPAAEAAA